MKTTTYLMMSLIVLSFIIAGCTNNATGKATGATTPPPKVNANACNADGVCETTSITTTSASYFNGNTTFYNNVLAPSLTSTNTRLYELYSSGPTGDIKINSFLVLNKEVLISETGSFFQNIKNQQNGVPGTQFNIEGVINNTNRKGLLNVLMFNGETIFNIEADTFEIGTPYSTTTTQFVNLQGNGTAYACLDQQGILFRSNAPCN